MNPGFVLGVMDKATYKNEKLKFNPGDVFFMYTDGVNEAMSVTHEQYAYERLKNDLKGMKKADPKELIQNIKKGLDAFTAGAEQSDDITMLAFKYTDKKAQAAQ
jgi:sigma-B regulation protein RsbU (phosphoserine phosphatase)